MILALSYALAMFLSQVGAISSDVGTSQAKLKAKQSSLIRTMSETNYILFEYGLLLESRRLNRREQLALALTNLADSGQ
jgi:hypothetical protein